MANITYSLIIPVYKNYESLPELLDVIEKLGPELDAPMETIFVVDASPDQCWAWLNEHLKKRKLLGQVLLHSRNFGSFAAIRSGLSVARGNFFAVMAADLQEPPDLVVQFFQSLKDQQIDVVVGARDSRDDPFFSKVSSNLFWSVYRRFVQPEMPKGGIDIFGCNQVFREKLLGMKERNSSLIGLLLWLGFNRKVIGYDRRARAHGKSAWTFRKKINYLLDSVFAFSDLPLKLLMGVGGVAMLVAFFLGVLALVAKLTGQIQVQGYTMLIIAISFFGALNMFALGLVGSYVWRAFENTKERPLAIVSKHTLIGKSDE